MSLGKSCIALGAAIPLCLLLSGTAYAQETTPTVLWNVNHTLTSFAAGVAIGTDGNPIVTGTDCNTQGDLSCTVRTIKYAALTGAVIWSVLHDKGVWEVTEQAGGITLDPDDNPIVSFTACFVVGPSCDVAFAKYSGEDGSLLWQLDQTNAYHYVGGVAAGPDGRPVAAQGWCADSTTAECYGILEKVDPATNAIIYDRPVAGADTPFATLVGVAVDASNNSYTTGMQCDASGQNCNTVVVKVDSAGADLADIAFDSGDRPGYSTELGWGVAIGPDGLPVVTGVTCTVATNCDFHVLKFDTTGLTTLAWDETFDNAAGNDALLGGGVAVGMDAHPVVVGASCVPDYPACNGRVMKLDGATGAALWTLPISGASTTSAQAVAIGADGNPVVAGYDCDGDACSFRTTKLVVQHTTAVGANQTVNFNGGQTVPDGTSITFTSVTGAGNTSLWESDSGPAFPGQMALTTIVGPRYFYLARTTTLPNNSIKRICVNYSNLPIEGNEFVYTVVVRNNAGTAWIVASNPSRDPANNVVCGDTNVNALTIFAVARP